MAVDDQNQQGCWTLILVHGTWGRGFFPNGKRNGAARWFEEGSTFRHGLTRAFEEEGLLPPKYLEHHWSGRNSFYARERSALELARRIKKWRTGNPANRLALIGHSHGGNVLLRTVAHIVNSRPLPSLVSLATPFVELAADEMSHYSDNSLIETISFIAVIVIFGIFAISTDLNFSTSIAANATIIAAFFWRQSRSALRLSKAKRKVNLLVRRSSHRVFLETSAALLVVRGVDDEAALALAAGAISARIGYVLDRLTTSIFFLVTAVVSAIAITLIASDFRVLGFDKLSAMVEPYYISACILFLAALALLGLANAITRIAPAVYGTELLLMPADIEVNSHSVPDASGAVTVRTLSRSTNLDSRMRHGIYDEPDCARAIAQWIKTQRGC